MHNLVEEIFNLLETFKPLLVHKAVSEKDWKDAKEDLAKSTQQHKRIKDLIAEMYAADKENSEALDAMLCSLRGEFLEYTRLLDIEPLISKVWQSCRENIPKKTPLYLNNLPLKIQQDKQIHLKDVYIFAVLPDYIVTNDAYHGLLILNKNLEIIGNILIFPNMLIEEMYTHPEKNELVLYSNESKYFIWVNIESRTFFIIDIPEELSNYPEKFYLWKNNTLLFTSRNNTFYVLDLLNRSISKKSPAAIKRDYPQFFMHSSYIDNHCPKAIISDQPFVIFRDNRCQKGIIVNTETGTEISFPHEYDFYCFAHYHDFYKYMVICEYSISFIDDQGYYLATLEHEDSTEFLQTFYFGTDGFITLIYDYNDSNREKTLRIYNFHK